MSRWKERRCPFTGNKHHHRPISDSKRWNNSPRVLEITVISNTYFKVNVMTTLPSGSTESYITFRNAVNLRAAKTAAFKEFN